VFIAKYWNLILTSNIPSVHFGGDLEGVEMFLAMTYCQQMYGRNTHV
jgi:hypothetical protein